MAQVTGQVRAIAAAVPEKTRPESSPDTKAPEQRTCATKPVATLGASYARTAVNARAPHNVVVTRRMILFFRVTIFSGSLSPSWRAGHELVRCARARRIRKSQ